MVNLPNSALLCSLPADLQIPQRYYVRQRLQPAYGNRCAENAPAQFILLLISADFLASDYCWGVELQEAMRRHHAGAASAPGP